MADAVLTLDARYTGRRQVRQAERDILKVKLASAGARSEFNKFTKAGDRMANAMGKAGKKLTRIFTDWDKLVRGFGTIITKTLGAATKFFVAEFALMAASMIAVHALFKIGRWLMKGYHGAIKMVAAAAAGATAALAILSAAIREQQAAMFSYKGLKGNYADLTSGVSAVRAQMRGMATDVRLATLGVENLNTIFSGASQRGTYSQGLAKGLLDVAHAGRSGADAAKWIGEVVGLLTDPKVQWSEIENAFRGMGKEGEKTMDALRKKGIDTVAEMKSAVRSGELSVIAGMEGQFDAVAGTLMSKLKGAFTIIRTDFADLGDAFMGDTKETLDEVVHVFRRMFVRIHGSILRFGSGGFLSTLVSAAEWLEKNMGKLVSKWLPMAEGMFGRISDWWTDFKAGWERVTNSLEPLIASAQILEDMFKRILVPMGDYLKDAFGEFGNELSKNASGFEEFGDAVGNLLTQFFSLTSAMKKMWLEAMPFISKVVDGLSQVFEVVTGLINSIGGIFGAVGGGMKGFAPMAAMMFMRMGGKQLSGTRGTVVPPTTGTMNVQAGAVYVNGRPTGATGQGNLGGKPPPGSPGYVPVGGRGQIPGQQTLFDDKGKGLASKAGGPAGGVVAGGGARQTLGAKTRMRNWARSMNQQDTRTDAQKMSRYQRFRANKISPMLTGRGAQGISRAANSMSGKMGGMMAMGMLGGMMGEEAQGSMALGSMMSMIDPRIGLAVGLGGAAMNARTMGGGAMTGMGAGAAAGAYFGPWGIAAGAIIGGVAGAIAGAIGEGKAITKEVKEMAKKQADAIWDGMVGGIRDASKRYGGMVGMTGARTQEAWNLTPISELMEEIRKGTDLDINPEGRPGKKERDLGGWLKVIIPSLVAGVLTGGVGGLATMTALMAMDVGEKQTETKGHFARQDIMDQIFARQDEFGFDMTEKDLAKAKDKPLEWMQDMGKDVLPNLMAGEMLMEKYNNRLFMFNNLTGLGEEGVRALADAVGVNLMDATMDTTEMIRQMAAAMVGTTEQMNQLFGEIQAGIFDLFQIEISRDEATFAFDERAAAFREMFEQGDVTDEETNKFLQDSLKDFVAIYGGDEVAGTKAWYESLGAGGGLYTQERGYLQGLEGVMLQGRSAGLMGEAGTRITAGQTIIDEQYVQSLAMRMGVTAQNFGAFGVTEKQRLGVSGVEQEMMDIALMAQGTEDQRIARQTAMDAVEVKMQEILGANFSFGTLDAVIGKGGKHDADAANMREWGELFHTDTGAFGTSVGTFNKSVNDMITMFGGAPSRSADETAVSPDDDDALPATFATLDTAHPFRGSPMGDVSSAFAGTMAAHGRISSGIAGKRTITSGYRNYALGSSTSDHLTGRALDLTGNNLGAYGDRVRAGGGFAELHGVSGSRHLHAVPVGDTMSPGGRSGGTGSTYNYTINVTGGPDAGAEEVAMLVMTEIQNIEKSNRERA